MSFLQEKQSRRYLVFLGVFIVCLLCFGVFCGWMHGQETKSALLEREQAIASSLIEQGVELDIVATALKNPSITEDGLSLLRRIGQTEQTLLWLLPDIHKSTILFFRIVLTIIIFFGIVLLLVSICFLCKRESLYKTAVATIIQFAEGDFQKHLPRNERGTIYQLFAAINQLATALQAKNDTEHRTKEFLKNTISDISHQLKTPLAALNMYTEIILEEPDNAKAVEEFSEKSMKSLERMEQLIQSLLKVMRLDAGSITFEKKFHFVSELIYQAVDNLRTRAEIEGKRIVIRGNESEKLFCDLEWTGEAVGNLIKNALDHTAPGGTICIEWQRSPAMLRLWVSDNGCGIEQEDIHHIFKRFYRSKGSGNRQGVGLGLPLAKAIIEGQGDLLSVQSEYGIGTTFTISFLTDL